MMYNASNTQMKANRILLPTGSKTGNFKRDQFYYRTVYLSSDHWKNLRLQKLELNPKCEHCSTSKHLDVHHISYKELYNVKLKDLKTLCRSCHELEHKRLSSTKIYNYRPKQHKLKRIIKDSEYFTKLKVARQILNARIYGNKPKIPKYQFNKQKKFDNSLISTFNREKRNTTFISIHY